MSVNHVKRALENAGIIGIVEVDAVAVPGQLSVKVKGGVLETNRVAKEIGEKTRYRVVSVNGNSLVIEAGIERPAKKIAAKEAQGEEAPKVEAPAAGDATKVADLVEDDGAGETQQLQTTQEMETLPDTGTEGDHTEAVKVGDKTLAQQNEELTRQLREMQALVKALESDLAAVVGEKVEVQWFIADLPTALPEKVKEAARQLEALRNKGWRVVFEQIGVGSVYTRLERGGTAPTADGDYDVDLRGIPFAEMLRRDAPRGETSQPVQAVGTPLAANPGIQKVGPARTIIVSEPIPTIPLGETAQKFRDGATVEDVVEEAAQELFAAGQAAYNARLAELQGQSAQLSLPDYAHQQGLRPERSAPAGGLSAASQKERAS